MDVSLTPDECRAAAYAGIHRRLDSLSKGRVEVYGKAAGGAYWDIDCEAAAAELALAKALGVFWVGGTDPVADRRDGDVAGLQVRHTKHRNGKLILHNRDSDAHTFVLVVGAMPEFEVVGFITGAEGKQPQHWWANAPRPAYFVAREFLAPFAARVAS